MEQIFFLFQVRLPKGNPNFKWLKPRLRVTSRYSNPKVDRKVKLEILPNSASFWGVGDGLTSPVHLARELHGCPLGRCGVRQRGFHQTVAVGARETEGGHLGGRQTSRAVQDFWQSVFDSLILFEFV